jgi:hypothetical protein
MSTFELIFLTFLIPLSLTILYFKIKISYSGLQSYRTTEYTKWNSKASAGGSGMVRSKNRKGVENSTSAADCAKKADEFKNKSNLDLMLRAILSSIPIVLTFLLISSYMLHELLKTN